MGMLTGVKTARLKARVFTPFTDNKVKAVSGPMARYVSSFHVLKTVLVLDNEKSTVKFDVRISNRQTVR